MHLVVMKSNNPGNKAGKANQLPFHLQDSLDKIVLPAATPQWRRWLTLFLIIFLLHLGLYVLLRLTVFHQAQPKLVYAKIVKENPADKKALPAAPVKSATAPASAPAVTAPAVTPTAPAAR